MPQLLNADALHAAIEVPSIAAVFVIKFDQRVGYTLAWHRSAPDGLSAFKSEAAGEQERNARFVSVGVLVPKHHSRLGRIWLHKTGVEKLAVQALANPDNYDDHEAYWHKHKTSEDKPVPAHNLLPDNGNHDNEAAYASHISESTSFTSARAYDLAPSHPVLNLVDQLDLLGPLVFPVYRSAILRKRIVLISKPPMEALCSLVYMLSIISSIPALTTESLPDTAPETPYAPPLFNIGIHDIPYLQSLAASGSQSRSSSGDQDASVNKGWIACTSDELLATKETLSDIRVTVPHSTASPTSTSTQYPSVSATSSKLGSSSSRGATTSSNSTSVKGTQRDLRRYKSLRWSINSLCEGQMQSRSRYRDTEEDDDDDQSDEDHRPLLTRNYSASSRLSSRVPRLSGPSVPYEDKITEPLPWSAALYGSFMWWASAGQRSLDTDIAEEEDGSDRGLWLEAAQVFDAYAGTDGGVKAGAVEMAIITYFHGLTSKMLKVMAAVVAGQTDDADAEQERMQTPRTIQVSKDDLIAMGLDVWSAADHVFAAELCELYFGREAEVVGGAIEVCGVRIC